MSYQQTEEQVVVRGGLGDRAKFITKTYNHLLGAIFAFVLISVYFYQSGISLAIAEWVFSFGGGWMVLMGGFIAASWAATHIAHTSQSKITQYSSLAGFIIAEAIIFAPLLLIAAQMADGVIKSAATVTLLGFAVLTAIVFYTRKDFSFLRGILMWMFGLAIVAIISAFIFGFQLGTWFSVAMIGFAGAAILYDTSNVLHHYPEDRYVGAALQLFASVAMMFWYVLRLFMSSND
ncbi:permease [Kangiella profundi]|uniref:Permease n=1 Tax=Kangiella profundi TaxID=1561924 RepID=A0A2K9ADL3_9GAMM|nr:Bax inhibitor-1 family protein [Kangiella profundi]AUD79527.1 permease [Kangiella profundi]GGE97733.1 permease [Kangiella profundi]